MKKAVLKSLDSGDGGGAPDPWPDGGGPGGTGPSVGGGEVASAVNGLLHGQLQTLRSERTALAAALAAARDQHAAAARQWDAERRQLCGGGGAGSDVVASRIMELSRRQRHLTAELEAERARRRRLEARLAEPVPARVPPPPPPAAADESEGGESVSQLRDRLRDTTRRLVEARNQAGAARRELRQAERLLQQEVGDGASLQQLLAAGSGWRGRAQLIVTLRAQLRDLQSAASRSSEPRLSAADSRARSHLRSLGREQQAQARQAAAEAERRAEETAALRLKLEAARSRAAVLTQETTQLREQTARLSEKCRNDDEMIEQLEAQVRRLETELGDGAARPTQTAAPVCGGQLALLRAQLMAREADVARLERQLAEAPAAEEPPPSPLSPPPPPAAAETAELAELRRRCLEADFLAEAAVSERRRLTEVLRELQQRLAESERRADSATAALSEERRAALAARRETEQLRQVLGRGRRPAPRPTDDDQQPGAALLLRQEAHRLAAELETVRAERQTDLHNFQQALEEAREIFCRGLLQAQETDAAG